MSFCYILLTICIVTVHSSIYSDLKDNVLSYLQRAEGNKYGKALTDQPKMRHFPNRYTAKLFAEDKDAKAAKNKARVIKKARRIEKQLNGLNGRTAELSKDPIAPLGKERYHMDPVLNFMKRRTGPNYRRKRSSSSSSTSSSSSLELMDWKEEWGEHWIQKKFEAINSTEPRGDMVNMVAARPWAVPCGDPNQHDMPWGTCMLPMECDPEFRVYRGDYFCGRTNFICCALQYTAYDLYQGFDVSFDDSSFSTDSEEKKGYNSKDDKSSKRKQERKKRKRDRKRRKRTIKRTIRKIIREMQKILSKAYRNGTTARKKKTKQLKKYIRHLKRQYRKERKAVKEIHEQDMIRIDAILMKKLDQIRQMNDNFLKNSTFRDIVVNGTITKQGARMLVQAYPELETYMDPRLHVSLRRDAGGEEELAVEWETPKDYLDYDIEYGLLYP